MGEDVSVFCIGQAGENLVRFACPVVDYNHSPGRSHAGCVMGVKKLKAIAVRGKNEIPIAYPGRFQEAVTEVVERITSYPERGDRLKTGSNFLTQDAARLGMVPARNFQTGILEIDSEILNLPRSAADYLKAGPEYGHHCSMSSYYGCNLVPDIKEGKYAKVKVGGVSFSLPGWEWGAKCGIRSYPAMWKCRELCQRYGMDQNGPIPFAMELYQRGIITKEDTDGLELDWGNEDSLMEMLRKIAYREGLGDVLADGSLRAARKIGMGAERYALTVKGMEIQYLDPRVAGHGGNLGTLVGPRGDDLNTIHAIYESFPGWAERAGWSKEEYLQWFVGRLDMFEDIKKQIFGVPPRTDAINSRTVEGKAALVKWYGELSSVYNSLGLCLFAGNCFSATGPTHFAKLYSACTGWETTSSEIMMAGERIFNLMKSYIVREGLTREHDDWPARFYEDPLPEGPAKGAVLSKELVSGLLDEYYELMGWDKKSGLPKKAKLLELGLNEVAGDLERRGRLPKTSS